MMVCELHADGARIPSYNTVIVHGCRPLQQVAWPIMWFGGNLIFLKIRSSHKTPCWRVFLNFPHSRRSLWICTSNFGLWPAFPAGSFEKFLFDEGWLFLCKGMDRNLCIFCLKMISQLNVRWKLFISEIESCLLLICVYTIAPSLHVYKIKF